MPFKKGKPKTGGRPAGQPNKTTRDVREAIAMIAQNTVDKVELWLSEIEDPGQRVRLFLDMCEYHIPKLARTEHTGKDGQPIIIQSTPIDEQL
jgi:hypothetical protein